MATSPEPTPSRPRGRPREGRLKPDAPATNQSLEKALGLLKVLSAHDGMSLTELSREARLAASTAHRLLATLSAHDLVSWDEPSQKWSIGIEALRIGMAFQRRNRILTAGRPEMLRLMEATGETVNLAMLDSFEVVFVAQVECEAPIRAFFRIGDRRSAHASGIGKALLAQLEDRTLDVLLKRRDLPQYTPKTLITPEALRSDLSAIRARGWSLDDEEAHIGMRCVAAPVFNEYGEARAGISLSGPSLRLSDDRLPQLAQQVRETAARITELIGGHLLNPLSK
ncbi:IclR family transcriptional regulator [Asticcacaulis sp.]|uniref:IclR family transcriptional regulator n=1 Tax=Asticcacaulis sp. TaxID=1872648 RepID=UPI00391C8DB7